MGSTGVQAVRPDDIGIGSILNPHEARRVGPALLKETACPTPPQPPRSPLKPRPTLARILLCLLLVVSAAALLSACGDDGDSTAATQPTSTDAKSPAVADARKIVEELSTDTGTYTSPPTEGPKATPGKNIWVIGYGNVSPASVALEKEWKESLGPALDWTVKFVDGKIDPNVWLEAIRNAVNAGADGIVTQFVDCPSVKSGLLAAKEAKVPVISINGADCEDEPLFAGVTTSNYGSLQEANAAYGKVQASWVIADSNGTANVVSMENVETTGTKVWTQSWKDTLAACEGCEVASTTWSFGDLGPKLQQKTQQALLKAPDADYVWGFVDDAIAAGIASGVKAAGRKVKLVGFDCDPNILKLMKAGEVASCFDATPTWPAYAAADGLVRVFAGEQPSTESGRGLMLVTPKVNFPTDLSRYPEPAIDFRKIYQTTWGVG